MNSAQLMTAASLTIDERAALDRQGDRAIENLFARTFAPFDPARAVAIVSDSACEVLEQDFAEFVLTRWGLEHLVKEIRLGRVLYDARLPVIVMLGEWVQLAFVSIQSVRQGEAA